MTLKRTYFHFDSQCWDKDWANMQPCCWNPWRSAEWRHVIKIHHSRTIKFCVTAFSSKKQTNPASHTQWSNTEKNANVSFNVTLPFEAKLFYCADDIYEKCERRWEDVQTFQLESLFTWFVFDSCAVLENRALCWPSRRIDIFWCQSKKS